MSDVREQLEEAVDAFQKAYEPEEIIPTPAHERLEGLLYKLAFTVLEEYVRRDGDVMCVPVDIWAAAQSVCQPVVEEKD